VDADHLLASLSRMPAVLRALLAGLDAERVRRRGPDGGWSILEILGHLLDEEREDFPPRLFATLEDPTRPWPPIDPEARVRERAANETASLEALLFELTTERAAALARLRVLPAPDWSRTYAHPALGSLSAGDLLVSWVAHDQLHLRQLLGRLREAALDVAGEASAEYAGPW